MKRTLCLALLLLATTVGVESACQPLLPLRHRTVKYFSSTGQELYAGPFPTGTRAVASCPKGMIIAVCFPLSPLGQRTVRYFADGKEFHFEHYSPGFVAVASCPAGMQLVGRKTALRLHGYWEKLGTCV
ncbi:unnamed protein product [Nippostrongylus brasiliensis]|uniref:Secreted protein n=1 Tax=Nippostrongylus brasiliensis TaxID=27835 RepID=A0A0N4YUI3_NIPBR|nr:unnamed protein product [Nippostrongylus brasiliensis]